MTKLLLTACLGVPLSVFTTVFLLLLAQKLMQFIEEKFYGNHADQVPHLR